MHCCGSESKNIKGGGKAAKGPSALTIVAIIAGVVLVGAGFAGMLNKPANNQLFSGYTAEVFYSPSCGCCVNYIGYLRDSGFNVKAEQVPDVGEIKSHLKIPAQLSSCHTTKIGKYFIEGHMPVEAIQKLLQESPDIDGIALPGMPHGSPGMPGSKNSAFEIYAIKNGQVQGTFVKI